MNQNKRQGRVNSAKDLEVYQLAYELAMQIFEISKTWPKEERYSLTDQIRRSSRSVCGNLREAWAKRRYEAHFVSKLSDCDGENPNETCMAETLAVFVSWGKQRNRFLVGFCQGLRLHQLRSTPRFGYKM